MRNKSENKMLVLSDDDIRPLVSYKEALEVCEDVFRWIGEGKITQPMPEHMAIYYEPRKGQKVHFGVHGPAFIEPIRALGVKANGQSVIAASLGLPTINGVIVLYDWETLETLAVFDEHWITTIRTGGHSGVGAKYLARKDSSVISIIGCGAEGRSHLGIMNELFNIKEVRIFDIKKEAMNSYSGEMGNELKLNIRMFDSAKEAVKGADVICMVTTSPSIVVYDEWIEPGTHVARAAWLDLDPKFSRTADKWVQGWKGELGAIDRNPNVSKENIYALLTDIVTGKKPGRETDKERTASGCMGIGALDVAVAHIAYKKAKENRIGTEVKMR
jgi:ornithine cyclodeaminase/alanine dehydrogenase-like protein (mu-crystallin family)